MYKRISEIRPEDRPYERCKAYGPGRLSDSELLAVILRTGTAKVPVMELSRQILDKSPGGSSLMVLRQLSAAQFMEISGIGEVKAIQLSCIGEICRRIVSGEARQQLSFSDPESIARYYMETLRYLPQETVYAMYLNSKNHLISERQLSLGTVNESIVSPSDVLRGGIETGASSFVLIHNHPSGDPAPSQADRQLTKRIREAALLMGLQLHDHIIIGDNCYFSFFQAGDLND